MTARHWLKISFVLFLILAGCKNSRGKDIQPVNEEKSEQLPATDPESVAEFTVHDVGNMAPAEVFPFILSQFKGKAILIDVWATWCGPCRIANEELKPVKAELAGKEIVYVFIAGENSPLETWKKMIPGLHGEHFRLSEKQWNYLGEKFNLHAVPTYFFIDREGKMKEMLAGYPGVEKMRKKMFQLVNE
ncbi:hypothetical protein FACS1894182_09530 [Bacteroidia bacterium]|nr:hypothetical protein FACS1894182_09530 [Bacteroidia bacterium]